MTAPVRTFSTEFGRFYAHPASGVPTALALHDADYNHNEFAPRPSITNIIATMDEKFLPRYYAKLVAEYAIKNRNAVQYQAETFGDEIAINALKSIPSRSNEAAAIGDEVHEAIDEFHQNGMIPLEFSTITAKRMFSTYRKFVDKFRPEVLRTEFTVWSYKYGYAGTGDILWRLGDAFWIVDVKTGNRVYPKVAMQCAALQNADVVIDHDGSEIPVPKADKLGVLHVRPMSTRLYELHKGDEAFKAFLGLLEAFNWARFSKAATLGPKPILEVDSKDV